MIVKEEPKCLGENVESPVWNVKLTFCQTQSEKLNVIFQLLSVLRTFYSFSLACLAKTSVSFFSVLQKT